MISIQDAGSEILCDEPRNLYIMFGEEYGIKQTYLQHLSDHYGSCIESYSAIDLIKSFKVKSLVQRKPSLYVCRYDDDFYKNSDKIAKSLKIESIPGTLVLLYEDEKKFKKLDKLFPDNVVRVDSVSSEHVSSYLRKDFPSLDVRYVNVISSHVSGVYGQAKVVCNQASYLFDDIYDIDYNKLLSTFGLNRTFTENQMMLRTAARDFNGVMLVVDSFEGDLQNLVNGMCSVAIALDKVLDGKEKKSEYMKYADKWEREDVYNFFNQAYDQIMILRSGASLSAYESLVYLASLLKFKRIPSVSEVKGC